MKDVLNRPAFFIKQHLGLFKAACNFDILDPATGQAIMQCREENLGPLTKFFRFTDYKRNTPFDLQVRTLDGQPVVRVHRGISFFRQKIGVTDHENRALGSFRLRMFSLTSTFDLLDPSERPLCQLKGSLLAREFKFQSGDTEFARVTKKWGGLGKELFTEADNYMIQIADHVEPDSVLRPLILASALCIDMALKR